MNSKLKFIFYLAGILFLGSCQKDVDIFTPNGNPVGADTNWISAVNSSHPINELRQLLKREIYTDSIDATAGGTIHTSEDLTIIVPPGSFLLQSGAAASGKIYAETMLIKKKGDMVRMDKPTISFGRILVSGGEVFVRFRKENDELHLSTSARIYIKYTDVLSSLPMKLFYGDESNPEKFNWVPSPDSLRIFTQPPGYEITSSNLRWINCDAFMDSSGARVNVSASLPVDCTNANTAVYIVFKDVRSVMPMYGEPSVKKFVSAKIPVGKQVIIVSLTKKANNSYYLGHESVTVGANGTTSGQIVPVSIQPTSLTDIKAYLNTL